MMGNQRQDLRRVLDFPLDRLSASYRKPFRLTSFLIATDAKDDENDVWCDVVRLEVSPCDTNLLFSSVKFLLKKRSGRDTKAKPLTHRRNTKQQTIHLEGIAIRVTQDDQLEECEQLVAISYLISYLILFSCHWHALGTGSTRTALGGHRITSRTTA